MILVQFLMEHPGAYIPWWVTRTEVFCKQCRMITLGWRLGLKIEKNYYEPFRVSIYSAKFLPKTCTRSWCLLSLPEHISATLALNLSLTSYYLLHNHLLHHCLQNLWHQGWNASLQTSLPSQLKPLHSLIASFSLKPIFYAPILHASNIKL